MAECMDTSHHSTSQPPIDHITDDPHLFYPPGTDDEGRPVDRDASTSSAQKGSRDTPTQPSKEKSSAKASMPRKAPTLQGTPAPTDQQPKTTTVVALPQATKDVVSTEVEEESDMMPGTPTPSPIASPQPLAESECLDNPCLHDSDLGESDTALFEDSAPEDGSAQPPTTTLQGTTLPSSTLPSSTLPSSTLPATCRPVDVTSFETRLTRVEARQESMLQIMQQQVEASTEAMSAIVRAIAANTAAVEASTRAFQECMGTLTEAIRAGNAPMQRPHLDTGSPLRIDTSATTTPATSAQSSPVRHMRSSAQRPAMAPPNTKMQKK
ncbi:uncharacterized protein [Ambystoma mexicanum]|uniref:uncharacterized protein n=1 Tax=Ambystoma mexicanum TaxID=8296 RepID=UPI0037E8A64A